MNSLTQIHWLDTFQSVITKEIKTHLLEFHMCFCMALGLRMKDIVNTSKIICPARQKEHGKEEFADTNKEWVNSSEIVEHIISDSKAKLEQQINILQTKGTTFETALLPDCLLPYEDTIHYLDTQWNTFKKGDTSKRIQQKLATGISFESEITHRDLVTINNILIEIVCLGKNEGIWNYCLSDLPEEDIEKVGDHYHITFPSGVTLALHKDFKHYYCILPSFFKGEKQSQVMDDYNFLVSVSSL